MADKDLGGVWIAALMLVAAAGVIGSPDQDDPRNCIYGADDDADGFIDDLDADCAAHLMTVIPPNHLGPNSQSDPRETGWFFCNPDPLLAASMPGGGAQAGGCQIANPLYPLGGTGNLGAIQCIDGIDNDADGLADWLDPDCLHNMDDSE